MAAKPQLSETIPNSGALRLFRELPWTPENRRQIALAFIEEVGDIPLGVEHSFYMEARDLDEVTTIERDVDELRAQHFKSVGKPVPKRVSRRPLR